MKTINVTDETYTALLSLGVIKEEQIPLFEVRDDGRIKTIIKELQPWEKYPTLGSCWEEDDDRINVNEFGNIVSCDRGYYNYSTESEAKKARATIFLSRIAKKWNEGVDADVYFIKADFDTIWYSGSHIVNLLPFYFHSAELAEKSLELFPDVWKDFYGR